MTKTSLETLQDRFWKAITAPSEVESLSLPVEGRMDIYFRGYFSRILGCLGEQFKILSYQLGSESFENLCRNFIRLNPSIHFSIDQIGSRLPVFLKNHELSRRRPWLAELAHFEWLREDIFCRADEDILTSESLASLKPELWSDLRFQFIKAFDFFQTRFRIEELDDGFDKDLPPRTPVEKPALLKIWRRSEHIFYSTATDEEEKFLRAVNDGKNFSQICESFSDEREPEKTVYAILSQWLSDQILTNFTAKKPSSPP